MNYKEQLRKQLRFIGRSCQAYDEGDLDEAIRIATQVRVIFHQTKSSISLLTHLNAVNMMMCSTAAILPLSAAAVPRLTSIELSPAQGFARYIPNLDKLPSRSVPLDTWWTKEAVYMKNVNEIVSRRDLVMWAANKDGGAHVDTSLDPTYEKLEAGAWWSMTVNPDNGPSRVIPFTGAHLAALRQIGHEVLNSPHLVRLA